MLRLGNLPVVGAAAMPKKAGNAVNEFDDSAWNAAFSQMTEDRKELSSVFTELQETLQKSSRRPPQETS